MAGKPMRSDAVHQPRGEKDEAARLRGHVQRWRVLEQVAGPELTMPSVAAAAHPPTQMLASRLKLGGWAVCAQR